MSANPLSSDVQVLHSWKAISSYMGRGVRTLQRYELELGFPVHRPSGKSRSSVLAFKHEIDHWMALTPSSALRAENATESEMPADRIRHVGNDFRDLYLRTERWSAKANSMQLRLCLMREGMKSTRILVQRSMLSRERGKELRRILRERMRAALKRADQILGSCDEAHRSPGGGRNIGLHRLLSKNLKVKPGIVLALCAPG